MSGISNTIRCFLSSDLVITKYSYHFLWEGTLGGIDLFDHFLRCLEPQFRGNISLGASHQAYQAEWGMRSGHKKIYWERVSHPRISHFCTDPPAFVRNCHTCTPKSISHRDLVTLYVHMDISSTAHDDGTKCRWFLKSSPSFPRLPKSRRTRCIRAACRTMQKNIFIALSSAGLTRRSFILDVFSET